MPRFITMLQIVNFIPPLSDTIWKTFAKNDVDICGVTASAFLHFDALFFEPNWQSNASSIKPDYSSVHESLIHSSARVSSGGMERSLEHRQLIQSLQISRRKTIKTPQCQNRKFIKKHINILTSTEDNSMLACDPIPHLVTKRYLRCSFPPALFNR